MSQINGVNKRSFDGCITCRNRKVKCGKERPKCLRCAKAKLECRGYGFTLKFKDIMVVDKNGDFSAIELNKDNLKDDRAKRQRLDLMHFPPAEYYSTFDEVDEKLNCVEELESSESYKGVGPFGKFKIKRIMTARIDKTVYKKRKTESNTVLPSFSSIASLGLFQEQHKPESSALQLPLVPVLEISYQRKQLQQNYDDINTSVDKGAKIPTIGSLISSTDIGDSIATSLWIHPRLEIDAILTYQALVGSANVVKQSWDVIKRVIFSELYDTVGILKNRIVDKMNLSLSETEKITKEYVYDVFRALNDNMNSTVTMASFTSLLRSQRVQELVRLFVKTQPSLMHLSFDGGVFDTIVIPLLYKIVGELLVFECSVGLPGDWDGTVTKNGIEFRNYCDILKRTYCMVALSLTAFSQYKILFNEYGIYDESLKLFRCYIAFREMSLVNLGTLITPLLDAELLASETYKISNFKLLERIINVGLLKELILTLILAVYQDSSLDIICNYSVLHHVLRGIREYCRDIGHNEEQIDEIWEWFRYLDAFYKSCSKIDLENYIIEDEGFEDVRSDYNLIRDFRFNDYFNNKEFNKIEIQAVDPGADKSSSDSSDKEDELENDYNVLLKLPSRLAKRPVIEDKPPRKFSVRFHFAETDVDSDEILEDESLEESDKREVEYANDSRELKTLDNAESLVALDAISGSMPLNDREQIFTDTGKVEISHPSKISYRDSKRKPSSIELSFGMPLSLLELMERTVKLTDHKNWCLRKKIFARNFPKFCCDLEDDLISWKLEWDLYTEDVSDSGDLKFHSLFHKALYHLVVAFYNSLLMFFFRLIKESDPVLLQDHVSSTMKHLEELRILSLRSDFLKDLRISPPFWCFMISGSDATTPQLQHRFDELGRKWFVAGNKWIGKQVMMEVWRSREEAEKNENQENISWLDLVKDWEISGFN